MFVDWFKNVSANFVYVYEIYATIPSKELGHADGLSSLIPKFNEPFEDTVIALLRSENEIKNVLFNTISEQPVTFEKIRIEAKNDNFILKITKQVINTKIVPRRIIVFFYLWWYINVRRENGHTRFITKIDFKRFFYVGHSGMSKMKSRMRSFVYWPGMDRDIKPLVKTVEVVRSQKNHYL